MSSFLRQSSTSSSYAPCSHRSQWPFRCDQPSSMRERYRTPRRCPDQQRSLPFAISKSRLHFQSREIKFEVVRWYRPPSASQWLSDSRNSTLSWHLGVSFPAPLPCSQRLWRPDSHNRRLQWWPRRCNVPAPFGKSAPDSSSTSESLDNASGFGT
jgi:hypothetical protein